MDNLVVVEWQKTSDISMHVLLNCKEGASDCQV